MSKYAFDKVAFAKAFHGERWSRGLTTRTAGDMLGVSANTISRWERAIIEPGIVPFLHACGVLGMNPLDFIAKESELQTVLPGFEQFTQGELVPLSEQDTMTTFELLGLSDEEFMGLNDNDVIDVGETPLY